MAGRSAGSVTSRRTRHGEAPRAAAASPARGSSDSHAPPTTRITTEALKNTRPATIANGPVSRWRDASGPPAPISCSKATPTTTVGSTKGTTRTARTSVRPGTATRWRAKAAGRPRAQAIAVARVEVQSVNQTARRISGRVSTSSTPPRSRWPSCAKPRLSIPQTGSTKKAPSTSRGTRAVAASERRRLTIGCSSAADDVAPLLEPGVAVRGDGGGAHVVRVPRLDGVARPGRRQWRALPDREDVHRAGQRLLCRGAEQEVDEGLGALRVRRAGEDAGVLDLAEAGVEQRPRGRGAAALRDGERGRGVVGDDDRVLAVAAALGEVGLVGLRPAVG